MLWQLLGFSWCFCKLQCFHLLFSEAHLICKAYIFSSGLWIASLGLRENLIFFFNLNFYSEFCIRGCTKADLRDDGRISWIIYFMIPLQVPLSEKMYVKEADQNCALLNETSNLSYHSMRLIIQDWAFFLSFDFLFFLYVSLKLFFLISSSCLLSFPP